LCHESNKKIAITVDQLKEEFAMKIPKMFCFAVVLMASLLALWGCPKKAEMSTSQETSVETAAGADDERKAAEAAAAKAAEEARLAREARMAEEAKARELAAAAAAGLQPIYFDYDRSVIRDSAAQVMKANAEWLKAHPGATIRIEGNCDERGTREYNQALGQRRAANAKKYLADLGISTSRVTLLSYGKEKPLCTDRTEACRQKNRRADFTVMIERAGRN
jgi:peptidoglycan-associated lipoprotein